MCDGVTDEGEEAVGGTSGTVQGVCEDGDDEGQSVTLATYSTSHFAGFFLKFSTHI